MMCASTFNESNLTTCSVNQTIPLNTTGKVQLGSRSFHVHNLGNLTTPPPTPCPLPSSSSSSLEPLEKKKSSLEYSNCCSDPDHDLSSDIDIDFSASGSDNLDIDHCQDCLVHQIVSAMDYQKAISGTLPSEKKDSVQCTNVYPIFSTLSDRLSKYGIELDEDSDYKSPTKVVTTEKVAAGHSNPAFIHTNSTDSLRRIKGMCHS